MLDLLSGMLLSSVKRLIFLLRRPCSQPVLIVLEELTVWRLPVGLFITVVLTVMSETVRA